MQRLSLRPNSTKFKKIIHCTICEMTKNSRLNLEDSLINSEITPAKPGIIKN